jgi:hypothetical protein
MVSVHLEILNSSIKHELQQICLFIIYYVDCMETRNLQNYLSVPWLHLEILNSSIKPELQQICLFIIYYVDCMEILVLN